MDHGSQTTIGHSAIVVRHFAGTSDYRPPTAADLLQRQGQSLISECDEHFGLCSKDRSVPVSPCGLRNDTRFEKCLLSSRRRRRGGRESLHAASFQSTAPLRNVAELGIAAGVRSQASGPCIQRHQATRKSSRTPPIPRLPPECVELRSPDILGSWSSHVASAKGHRLLNSRGVSHRNDASCIDTKTPASLSPGDSDHTLYVCHSGQ